jgi:Meiotically up-regulated gene 113
MNKPHILAEITRTANENGGVPLGRGRFFEATGIKESDWHGKYWARWGDAVQEAGFLPNKLQVPYEDSVLFEKYASLIREIGRLPAKGDFRLKATQDKEFPAHTTIVNRLGTKAEQLRKLAEYFKDKPQYTDLLALVKTPEPTTESVGEESEDASSNEQVGFVYLLKSARFFKVGRSNSFERRSRELAIQLPEKAETVHVIRTDDPIGIELYWHRRFESKRKNGEWFELSAQDVKAFKRRKFM